MILQQLLKTGFWHHRHLSHFETSKLWKEADSRLNVSIQLWFSDSDVLIRYNPASLHIHPNEHLFILLWLLKKNSYYYNNY